MSPSCKRCTHVIYQCYCPSAGEHLSVNYCCVTSKYSWSLFRWMSCGMKLNGFPSALSLFSAFPLEQPSSPWFPTKWSFFRSWIKCDCNIASLGCFNSGEFSNTLLRPHIMVLVKSQIDDVIDFRGYNYNSDNSAPEWIDWVWKRSHKVR